LACLAEQIAHGLGPTESQVRSLRGKIQHIRDLNDKKGLRLKRRFESLLVSAPHPFCPGPAVSSE
jgi:hypothetical protein